VWSTTVSRPAKLELASNVEIPGNLILRAADLALEAMGREHKCVPAPEEDSDGRWIGRRIEQCCGGAAGSAGAGEEGVADGTVDRVRGKLAATFRSSSGGAALGVGRGTELYPLPDLPPRPVLLVAPCVHVSTGELTQRSAEN